MNIAIKRIYDNVSEDEGYRILVDRLWPRGIKKEKARIDLWLKAIAPSNELRKWYSHDLKKWEEFYRRYSEELETKTVIVEQLRTKIAEGPVTFVYASTERQLNNAAALKRFIEERA